MPKYILKTEEDFPEVIELAFEFCMDGIASYEQIMETFELSTPEKYPCVMTANWDGFVEYVYLDDFPV